MTHRIQQVSPSLRPLAMALASAALLVSALPVHAQFSSSGNVYTAPGNQPIPTGAGHAELPTEGLFVGNDGFGSFSVLGGSPTSLRVGSLLIGASGSGGADGNGTVLIDGATSLVTLVGSGNRLNLGHQDIGKLIVSGGGTLNGRAEPGTCQSCAAYIGNAAGSNATLTVTGAGSSASFLGFFGVGSTFVDAASHVGIPGATTQAAVKILAGGLLTTDNANIGLAPTGTGSLGTERSFSSVVIDGPGSVWKITGDSLGTGPALFNTANHQNAWVTIDVRNGGTLWLDGKTGQYNGLILSGGSGGGRTDMLVTGTGSRLLLTGDAGYLTVGAGAKAGTATLGVTNGATISGLSSMIVGRNGSFGTMSIDGAGSQVLLDGVASTAAFNSGGAPGAANMQIGRDGGAGVVNVTGGANLSITSTIGTPNAAYLEIARGTSPTTGTLNITGAGSVVSLSAASAKNSSGVEQAYNPYVRIGRENGTGALNVSAGGKLLIDGQAVSTNNDRSTFMYIGGRSDTAAGGRGIASVTGAGSEIRMTGSDTYIGIGHGPQSSGQLTVADHASVSARGMIVGRRGGVGLLSVDNANVNIAGQGSYGAFLSVGWGVSSLAGSVGVAGNGTATLTNGGSVTINNMGSFGADLNVGGSPETPNGNGTLTLASGSSVSVQAASGLARARVGVNGTGVVTMSGGSSLNVGDGSLTLAGSKTGVGVVRASENSTITAGWVGIGRNGAGENGGVATMLLNSGAKLTAQTVVIGSNGYLGGTGGTIVANQITNYGIFSPGSSPGTFTIDGNYTAAAGSRMVLEVESNGMNGFNTDLVLFSNGSTIDLNAGIIEFRFLGATDPNAFKASGLFNLDTFLALSDGNGPVGSLQPSAYAGTQFSATSASYSITNFSYSPTGGASFTAAPVPEPSTWAMMFAGVALLGAMAARRRGQRGDLRAV